jgi:aspartate aminotransferase
MAGLLATVSPFLNFYTHSEWLRRRDEPGIADFVLGNPHEMPLPGFVDAMKKWSEPEHKDWFAYKDYIPSAQEKIAASLSVHRGIDFLPEDILINTGAFAGLTAAIGTVTEPGDEVIFISPPWFFYEGMIRQHGAVPVRVRIDMQTYGPDLDAIREAITEKTRAIIVNSPNNPTGRIYSPEELTGLARILEEASERHGQPIYIISDEAYSRILLDGRSFPSPAKFYPYTLLLYTYGKTLLIPGQRIGYIALPPDMPDRDAMRQAIFTAQIFLSYSFANAVLQYALEDVEALSIDIEHIQEKRDRVVPALREMGYEVNQPEGTFYLLLKSPLEDDLAFIDLLAEEGVFCLPGSVFEMPGFFRISLTANDEMVEIGLPGFARAIQRAKSA